MVLFAIDKYHYSNQPARPISLAKTAFREGYFWYKPLVKIATRNFQSFVALLPFYPYTSNYQFPVTDQENQANTGTFKDKCGYNGKRPQSAATRRRQSAATLSSSGFNSRSAIILPISVNSGVPIPLVVIAAEPSLKPLVTKGDAGSKGTVFLLAVIFTPLTNWSARLPVMFADRKSTNIK